MLDQSAYNYYLKEVLGVDQYIGRPQKVVTSNSSSLDGSLLRTQQKLDLVPIVVVHAQLNNLESELLSKIMKAVNQPKYNIVTEKDFNRNNIQSRYCLMLLDDYHVEQEYYEVFNINKTIALQSCSLVKLLPPTPDYILKENKQKLWKSIKLLFKV